MMKSEKPCRFRVRAAEKKFLRTTTIVLVLVLLMFCVCTVSLPTVDAFLTRSSNHRRYLPCCRLDEERRSKDRSLATSRESVRPLYVAIDPMRSSTSSSNFEGDNSNSKNNHHRRHSQIPHKSFKAKKLGRKRRVDAKDPAAVEAAMTVALEALRTTLLTVQQQQSQPITPPPAISALLFPSVRECNAALSAFGDAGDLLRALRLFGKMRKAARMQHVLQRTTTTLLAWPVPAPTLVTYSTLMSRAVRASKPHVALRLWNMMPSTLEPDVKAINILMNCYAKLGNVERAKQVLNEMEVEPNIVTFNTVLNACQKAADLDAALEIKALLDSVANIKPDAKTYTTLMATVARGKSQASGQKDPTIALSLLQEMYQRGVSPNGMTYSAFIEACGRCGRSDLALQALRLMQRQKENEKQRLGNTIDQYVLDNEVGAWTSAIHVCGKAGRWETAIRLFGSMKKLGCAPNTVTCGCLTDSLLRVGRTAETLQVLRYMKNEGIVPSEVMYTSLMTRADRLVQMENQVPLDKKVAAEESDTKAIEVYTELMMSLMEAAGKQRNVRRTKESAHDDSNTLLLKVFLVFQQMRAAGAEPDLACYNVLLRACARAGDISRAQVRQNFS